MRRFLLLLVCLTAFFSCEKEPTVGDRYAASVKPPTILYIYGGAKYDVYLGKLNASKFDTESIWNAYGAYGSKYRTNSIWNAYGTYGSEYNSNCPFNKYGSNPSSVRTTRRFATTSRTGTTKSSTIISRPYFSLANFLFARQGYLCKRNDDSGRSR